MVGVIPRNTDLLSLIKYELWIFGIKNSFYNQSLHLFFSTIKKCFHLYLKILLHVFCIILKVHANLPFEYFNFILLLFTSSHLAMQQVQNAAVLLARRYNCTTSLQTAARVSMIGNEKQSGMAYAHKLLQQFLLKWEWSQAYAYLKEQKAFQVGYLLSFTVLLWIFD